VRPRVVAVSLDRQIESPMPIPVSLVVKKGSKMWSAVAASSPRAGGLYEP
jgi:hypothetical protein